MPRPCSGSGAAHGRGASTGQRADAGADASSFVTGGPSRREQERPEYRMPRPDSRVGTMTADLVVPTRRAVSAPRVQAGRIVVIDVLRGIALFGMLVAHARPLIPGGEPGPV